MKNGTDTTGSEFQSRYRGLVFPTVIALLVAIGLFMLVPFFPAILWATVLSVLMTPLHRRIRKGKSPNVGAGLTTCFALAIVGIPILLVGAALFFQVNEFVQGLKNSAPGTESGLSVDHMVRELELALQPLIRSISPDFKLVDWFNEHKQNLLQTISAPAGKAAFSLGYGLFTLVVSFLTMFFMLRDGERLREPALDLIPLPREAAERVLERLSQTVRAVFVGIVLVALVQGSIAGATYYAVGVPQALLWGVATIVLCTIPLLGAPIIYIPMGLMLISQGKYAEAGILLGVGFLVVSQIDNILRPFIIGAKIELHPMAIFFSLLGGVFFFGPAGIMAGPMLLSVLLVFVDVLRERLRLSSSEPLETPAAPGIG